MLLLGKKPRLVDRKIKLDGFDRDFLCYVGLGPFFLTLVLSLLLGIKLRAGWGMPLLSLWGILLVATIQPRITKVKIVGLLTTVLALIGVSLSAYSVSLIASSDPSSANFPGHEIAQHITEQWHDTYHTPLAYVAGSRWVGGNIEFYSSDHPAVFVEWDEKRAPWIQASDVAEKGAVFVWSITDNETPPADLQERYPSLSKTTVMEFDWHRNSAHLTPIKIGVAILPPSTKKFAESN